MTYVDHQDFNSKLCEALIAANIPLEKLNEENEQQYDGDEWENNNEESMEVE